VEKRLQADLEGKGDVPALADVRALYSFAYGVELHEGEYRVFAERLRREVGETDSRRLDAGVVMAATVSISEQDVLELIAALEAARAVLDVLNDRVDSEAGEVFENIACDIEDRVFGFGALGETDDDEYQRDPRVVEVWAREHELAAEALNRLVQMADESDAYEIHGVGRNVLADEAACMIERARLIREAGTVAVNGPQPPVTWVPVFNEPRGEAPDGDGA